MGNKKMLFINLFSSVIAFLINIAITFLLTPYIVKSLGVEAYGFITLGTNFINFVTLITIALNSMASRFITIEIHKNNYTKANTYFTSVLYSNIVITMCLIIPSILLITFLEKLINIPAGLIIDVKLLFSLLFLNFFISTTFSAFSVATFATNRLYLNALRNIEANIFKGLLLIILFNFFQPFISYMGFVTLLVAIYTVLFNVYYTRKFLPGISLNKIYFKIKAVKELIISGIWNSLIRAGQILLDGLNLLIANIFLSATAMGTISVVNTIPMVMSTLIGTIASVFMPDFTILYAKEKKQELLTSIRTSMKVLGLVTNIPVACLVVFGKQFFELWIPTEDAQTLQILSVITLSVLIVSGTINSLYNVFTVTNKLKSNAIVLIITGIINLILVLILVNFTDLGVYGLVIVSASLGLIRNLVFTIPISAKYLGLKWNTFYPDVIKSIIGFIGVVFIGYLISNIIIVSSWGSLIFTVILTTIFGLILNSLLIFSKQDMKFIISKFRKS